MARHTVRCCSCGYLLRNGFPGPGCENPQLHQGDLKLVSHLHGDDLSQAEILAAVQRHQAATVIYNVSSPVAERVLAKIHVEAYKRGISKAQLAAEILTQWADGVTPPGTGS